MKSSEAVHRNLNGDEERFSPDENVGDTSSRSASNTAATCSHEPGQGLLQRGRISSLILAMAALRLDNKRTEEIVKREYEVLGPIRRTQAPQHVVGLDSEYVFVD
ncbi:hypothetical protein COCVIDRAFT_115407 [Bipolaris victoriae FI3]|uniref:Uncharacterized protein n=1 Tax=Bipolaris victoriae (strain FI3) TaxID=930091 RepID=W7E1I1_BIPV3|nr:hypothetical protein COCVIDRAFT_115407 [Bipolaris victoriae FI3]